MLGTIGVEGLTVTPFIGRDAHRLTVLDTMSSM
jgi:hypothetical protein